MVENGRTSARPARGKRSSRPRRTQAQRRHQTREALIEAALARVESGESFDALSLRGVARAAGVVPTAFYRYFDGMDDLGLVLVERSFETLRAMLRQAREQAREPRRVIARSVEILVSYVREHRQQFAFVARIRSTGNGLLRHAIRSEIRLFAAELATDLARFPVLRDWSTEDLQMLSDLLVNTMIATIEELLEVPPGEAGAQVEAAIARRAERQLRLIVLGVPAWRSR